MKIKLKKGEKLSSNYNFCNLEHKDWVALNQGRGVELDIIPSQIESKIENKQEISKKEVKNG